MYSYIWDSLYKVQSCSCWNDYNEYLEPDSREYAKETTFVAGWGITKEREIHVSIGVVDLRIQYCTDIFQDSFETYQTFYGAYLFSKSANSIFKILLHCPFWRNDFEKWFFKNYLITTTKNVTKIRQ